MPISKCIIEHNGVITLISHENGWLDHSYIYVITCYIISDGRANTSDVSVYQVTLVIKGHDWYIHHLLGMSATRVVPLKCR